MEKSIRRLISNSGFALENQFVISEIGNDTFRSYETYIAKKYHDGTVILDTNYSNYSKTTSRNLSIFLNESLSSIRNKVKSGVYKLVNLND
jgi:hypothetical protein